MRKSRKKPAHHPGPNDGGPADGVHSPAALPPDSLDDIAALMVQTEPTDLTGLAQARAALERAARQTPAHPLVSDLVAAAARQIDEILQGQASDPARTLAEAGRLVDQALFAYAIPDAPPAPARFTAPSPANADSAAMAPERAADRAPAESRAAEAVTHPPRSEASLPSEEALPPDTDLSLLGEFITESREHIEEAEAALLSLETDPENLEAVNTVFRAFHTIKGTSAFFGLSRLTEMAHRAESLLSRIRAREIRYTGGYADLALRSSDMIKAILLSIQEAMGGKPMIPPNGYDDLMTQLLNPEAAGVSGDSDGSPGLKPRLGDILIAMAKLTREEVEAVVASQGNKPIGEAFVKSQVASVSDVAKALRAQQRLAGHDRITDSSVRVRTDRLDRLIDMVGELVIAHSLMAQDATVRSGLHPDLARKVTHAGKIVRELQDLGLSLRMVPLKATFQKMARLARDVANKSEKRVDFVTEGENTEIDRNMVDVIGEPLVHMVRNAIDHGIEPPDVRAAQGKPPAGTLRLAAYHAGGNVVIELQDDGKGLDRQRIIKTARANGLLESDKGLSDRQVFDLIFLPGFSTADRVTSLSGRGVGMDVVKRDVESLRGRIDITSEVGKGCTFAIHLPLTLAITNGMLLKVGPERYILPIADIALSFRPTAGALSTIAGRGEMVLRRHELMPVFRLHRLFHIAGAVADPVQGLLVIIGEGERRCALLVDELLGQQQVVAKSLGDGLGKVPGISGGAILGDGRVGLILDAAEIVHLARQAPCDDDGQAAARRSVA